MSSHAVSHRRPWQDWALFGLGQVKPKHFRDMAKTVWKKPGEGAGARHLKAGDRGRVEVISAARERQAKL